MNQLQKEKITQAVSFNAGGATEDDNEDMFLKGKLLSDTKICHFFGVRNRDRETSREKARRPKRTKS